MKKRKQTQATSLEEILMVLGAKKPFKKDGKLSKSGEEARVLLVSIVEGLKFIDAVDTRIKCFEDYLDEIINCNY